MTVGLIIVAVDVGSKIHRVAIGTPGKRTTEEWRC